MIIRKISVGSDYKSAMHYIVGPGTYVIYVQKEDEVFLWKEFNANIPVSVEYNINY